MSTHQPRVQAGTPDGGRFAPDVHAEADVDLTGPASRSPEFTRELGAAVLGLTKARERAQHAGPFRSVSVTDFHEAAHVRAQHVAFLADPDLVTGEPASHRPAGYRADDPWHEQPSDGVPAPVEVRESIETAATDVLEGRTLPTAPSLLTRSAGIDHFLAIATEHDKTSGDLYAHSPVREAALLSAASLAAGEHQASQLTEHMYYRIVAATEGEPVDPIAARNAIDEFRIAYGMSRFHF